MKRDYDIPDGLLYTETHEWVRCSESHPGEATIGITDFAQDEVGDVVYVDYPNADSVAAGDMCAEIESTKTVAELYAPVDGEVIATNANLEGQPELVNHSPYDEGWMVRIRVEDDDQLSGLLNAGSYRALIEKG